MEKQKSDQEKIVELLKEVLNTKEYDEIKRLGGLTNHTYHVTLKNGKEYVVRIPGEGTEEMIVRSDEKVSTELACKLGIDAKMLYFGKDGSKVTEYISNAVTMSAETLHEEQHMIQMAEIFRKLHGCGVDTKVPFEVFELAAEYEKIINDKNVAMYDDYLQIKDKVIGIKSEIDSTHTIEKVPCHNDALCENWVMGDDRMFLIDWEYAGMNDGMWDLADVSIEAGYDKAHDEMFLCIYLGHDPSEEEKKHFIANKIYVDFLWTLWAKARVPYSGQAMEEWAFERYTRLKSNILVYENVM